MARYNRPALPRTQVVAGSAFPAKGTASQQATTLNSEGRTAWKLDEKTELFLGATSAFAGQDTFYEKGAKRDERLIALVRKLAVDDWAWTYDFLVWLRSEGNMRTAPIMLAVEAVRARIAAKEFGSVGSRVPEPGSGHVAMTSRRLIAAVLQRADEPGELMAYCENVYGRPTPKAIKRGVADAVERLYNERSFLRYNSESRALGFGSVIELAQMRRIPGWQGDLFRYAIDVQHGNAKEIPESLTAIRARRTLSQLSPVARHALARENNPDVIQAMAGSWEWLHSWLGDGYKTGVVVDNFGVQPPLTKKEQWELAVPHMGIFALVRNLRNLDEAGFKTGDPVVTRICERLASAEQIGRSRMLPFRFFTAYLELKSLTWGAALEQAANHSLSNIPELPGRTLVLVDTSGSMDRKLSAKSEMTYVKAATLFGTALAIANPDGTDLYGFADGQFKAEASRGHSLLRCAEDFAKQIGLVGHGTAMEAAVRATYDKHDRVIILSDMEAFPDGTNNRWPYINHYVPGGAIGDVAAAVPAKIPVYGFNLSAGKTTPLGKGNRHSLGGLTDHSFKLINQLEKTGRGSWPWES